MPALEHTCLHRSHWTTRESPFSETKQRADTSCTNRYRPSHDGDCPEREAIQPTNAAMHTVSSQIPDSNLRIRYSERHGSAWNSPMQREMKPGSSDLDSLTTRYGLANGSPNGAFGLYCRSEHVYPGFAERFGE